MVDAPRRVTVIAYLLAGTLGLQNFVRGYFRDWGIDAGFKQLCHSSGDLAMWFYVNSIVVIVARV